MRRRGFITLLGGAAAVFLCVNAAAQEGYYGVGHDKWHQGFYSKLKRNDGQGSCCNLMDCRPTQSRMVGDHYEVKVEVYGRLFPTTRSTTWSRPMVAPTSALRDRWVRTRALYFASYCRRRADRACGHQRSQCTHEKFAPQPVSPSNELKACESR
jgi:hypothetical protein